MDSTSRRRTLIAIVLVGAVSIAGLLWLLDPFGATLPESEAQSPREASADDGTDASAPAANVRAGAERVVVDAREPEPARDVGIAGQVVDAHGTPIAGANVVVSASSGGEPLASDAADDFASGAKRLRTDSEGRFALPLGGFGDPLDLVVDAEGFEFAELVGVRGGEPVVISLRPEQRIHGGVRDPGGRPIAGATVSASAFVRRTQIVRRTTSGDDGAYEVAWPGASVGLLEVELITLKAEKEGHAPDVMTGNRERLRMEMDGTLVCDLVLSPGFVVEGRVVDAVTRQGIPDAEVRVVERHPNSGSAPRRVSETASRLVHGHTQTARDGSFRFDHVAGRGMDAFTRLLVSADGHADSLEQVRRAADGERRVVEIALFPRVVVTGRVVDGVGSPIEGVTAHLPHPTDHARGEPWLVSGVLSPLARTARDGRFSVSTARPPPDAPKGDLQLRVELVRGFVAAGTDERRIPVDFAAESPIELGDLTFERPPQIELRVVDARGRPIAGAELRQELHGRGERADCDGRLFRNAPRSIEPNEKDRDVSWAFVAAPGFSTTLVGPLRAASGARSAPLEVRLADANTMAGVVRGTKEGETLGLVIEVYPEQRILEEGTAPPEVLRKQRLQIARIVARDLPFRVGGLPAGTCEMHVVRTTPPASGEIVKTLRDVPTDARDLVIDLE